MLLVSLKELDRNEYHRHAHRLLGEVLKKYGITYNETTGTAKGRYGKPYLAEHPEVHFSLSHANGIAACIVGENECGIDCERLREVRPSVMKRAFTAAERELVDSAPEEERALVFTRLWTLKESYIKMLGIGLSFPMSKAEFAFEEGTIVTPLNGCRFKQYIIKNSYVVSVCERIGDEAQHEVP